MYFVHCAVVSTTAQWTIYYCTVDDYYCTVGSCIPMDCLPGSDRWTSQLPCWAIQQHSKSTLLLLKNLFEHTPKSIKLWPPGSL